MSMFDDVCKFEEVAGAWNCFNMIFLETLVILKLLVLKITVQHAIATVYHPLSGQEQPQAVEDGIELDLSRPSHIKTTILFWSGPGHARSIEGQADKLLKMWSISDKFEQN